MAMIGPGRETRTRLLALCCGTVLGGSGAFAQAFAEPFEALRRDELAPLTYAPARGGAAAQPWQPAPQRNVLSRFYGGAEYLLWNVKGAPLSVPLVSTGPINTTHHGFLVDDDTTILYGAPFGPGKGGNDTQNFPSFSGARLTLGYWLDDAQRFAIEGRAFALERKSAGYEARCDANGRPILNIPVYNTISYPLGTRAPQGLPPQEDGLPPCLPEDPERGTDDGLIVGGLKLTNSLQLWGGDATGVMTFYRSPSWEFSALAGVRYLDLSESFNLFYDSTGVTGPYAGMYGQAWDQFRTHNQFYGASVGLRARHSQGPWSVELSGRVALGITHQLIDVSGGFFSLGYVAPGVLVSGAEGVFAQPAIQGTRTATEFAFVPEGQVKIGYAVTPWMRLTVGYEGLYYSNVVRPVDQVNRNLPKGQTFQQAGVAASASSPTPLFNRTDFWAHGLSVGLVTALNGPELVDRADIAPPPPAVSWSGWHVGGHVGGNWDSYKGHLAGPPNFSNQAGTPDIVSFGTGHGGSIVGGGQIGFDRQIDQWVFGVEADVAFANAKPAFNGPGSVVFATSTAFEFQNEWQGSLRGRVGFAFDRWLAYGTGGVAWSSTNVIGSYGPGSFFGGLTTPAATASERRILFGGTAGVGVEYALTNNISIAGEYRYTVFERHGFNLGSIPFPGGVAAQVTASVDKSKSELTARLNYRFGSL